MIVNKKGITIINLVITIAILGLLIIGGYFGFSTMIINNKKDNFINTAKEYVEGAKEQMLSENMMPNSGEGLIVPYNEINLGKKYLSPYKQSSFLEEYSYVVIVKTYNASAEYKYFVTHTDELGNCINLIDYDKIDNFSSEKREYVVNTCNTESILLVDPDFTLKNIDLGFDIKYYKCDKN